MTLKIGDRIDVYRNLRSGNFSIRKNGIVELRSDGILLIDPSFIVSKSGRERVLRVKQKNVHAVVRGTYAGCKMRVDTSSMKEGYYNPYRTRTFVDRETEYPLSTAKEAYFYANKVYYKK